MGFAHDVRINIFNISKINSEVRGGKEPRIKRMREVLGDSYFNHLASLDDEVDIGDPCASGEGLGQAGDPDGHGVVHRLLRSAARARTAAKSSR